MAKMSRFIVFSDTPNIDARLGIEGKKVEGVKLLCCGTVALNVVYQEQEGRVLSASCHTVNRQDVVNIRLCQQD